MLQEGTNRITHYNDEIHTLKRDVKKIISESITEDKEQNNSILHEINDNLNVISQRNKLLQIDNLLEGNSSKDSELVIDLESLPDKIDEFKSLLNSLVQLYLGQESLDQFLRITISDNKEQLLDIKSVKDPRYKNLENQVQILKEDNVDEREIEIENLRNNINSICQEILNKEDQLNDLTAKFETELTQCSDLLKELNEIHEVRNKKVINLENKETNKIQQYEQCIANSDNIKKLTQEKGLLQNEIDNWHNGHKSQSNINSITKNFGSELNSLKQNDKVIKKLIKIQEKHLLTCFGTSITEFKFLYQDSKKEITFRCHEQYNIKIKINIQDNSFEEITIHNINNHTNFQTINQLKNDINNKFYHNKNIFHIIDYVNNKLIHT